LTRSALATKALDEVRREHWNELRQTGETAAAKQFKHDRWALLKNPEDLTDTQNATLALIRAGGGKVARAWAMKEMARAIFATGLTVEAVSELLNRLLARLSRCRLAPFVRLGRTIRKHREGILAARRLKLSNAQSGGPEQQGEIDRPPRLRIPLRPRRSGPHPPHLRPDHTDASTQSNRQATSPTIIHGEPGIACRAESPTVVDPGVPHCQSDGGVDLTAADGTLCAVSGRPPRTTTGFPDDDFDPLKRWREQQKALNPRARPDEAMARAAGGAQPRARPDEAMARAARSHSACFVAIEVSWP
jgi:hypothetical protein